MTSVILDRTLPLAKRHVRWTLNDARTTLRRALEMAIDVSDVHENVLGYLISPLRTSKGSTLPAKHDGTFTDRKLCMANDAVTFGVKALGEAERTAEPIDGLGHILIDQDWNDGRCRC